MSVHEEDNVFVIAFMIAKLPVIEFEMARSPLQKSAPEKDLELTQAEQRLECSKAIKLLQSTMPEVLWQVMSILDICIDLNGQVEMVLTDQEDDQIREGIWLCARVVATRGRSTAQH